MQQACKFKKVKLLFGKNEQIPTDWEIKTFDELFEFLRTGTNSRDDLEESGDIQYIHYGDIHAKWNSVLDCDLEDIPWIKKAKVQGLPFLKDGDLIIADASEDYEGSGASVLLKNVKNRKIVSGLHTIVIRNIDKNIFPDFKTYLTSIRLVKKQIDAYVTGISVYGLSKSNLKMIRIPIPPLKEQQKIASVLSKVDELIRKIDQIIDKTQILKKGLMQGLLTKGIGHTKFKKTKLGEIPEEWDVKELKDISEKISVGIATSTTKYFVKTGIPLLRNQNIKEDYIDTNELIYITEEFSKRNSLRALKEGDVICVRTGYPGQSAVVTSEMNGWQTFTTLIIRPLRNKIDSHYLSRYLNSIVKTDIKSIQAGGSQQNLNAGWLSKMHIKLPTLEEQQEIVFILSKADDWINQVANEKFQLQNMKKGLVQQLTTGKIRVKV